MKRKDVLKELQRENQTRKRVFPRWIREGKIHKTFAKKRYNATSLAEAVFDVMTDEEFTQLVERLEVKAEQGRQGSLF